MEISFYNEYRLPIGLSVKFKNKIIGITKGWMLGENNYHNFIKIYPKYEKLIKKEMNPLKVSFIIKDITLK